MQKSKIFSQKCEKGIDKLVKVCYHKDVADVRLIGGERMVNVNKLRGRLVENGVTVEDVAKALNVSAATIYRKLQANGESFTIGEASGIMQFLHLTPDEATSIFFSRVVADVRHEEEEAKE
jgi:multidrug efflux pump subunit AcrB